MSDHHIPLYHNQKSKPQTNSAPKITSYQQQIPLNSPQKTTRKEPTKKRKTRSDKCHDIKFPLAPKERMRLKFCCKQADVIYKRKYGYDKKLTQTHFNTLLMRYSLKNEHIVIWDWPYSDSKNYMHIKPVEREYDLIGGPHGYSTRTCMSDRRIAYCLVISALEVMEREGKYESIL